MSDALSGPVGDLPDEAVEAAAKAVARAFGWGEDHFTAERVQHYSRYAGPALAAALPLIRAHIADELVEYARNGQYPWYGAEEGAVLGAADFVKRGDPDA
jgi:hypothetical protein